MGRVRVLRDRGLRVAPLRPEDSGVYLCKATNKAAEITANASLTVLSKCPPRPRHAVLSDLLSQGCREWLCLTSAAAAVCGVYKQNSDIWA